MHMHACDAAVHSKARENSPGTRVRGGEQGVRLFFFHFPRLHSVFRARLTIGTSNIFNYFPCPFCPFFFQLVERLRSAVRAWTCLSFTGQSFGTQQPWQTQQQSPPKHYKRKDDNNYY